MAYDLTDRARARTARDVLERIDADTADRLEEFAASPQTIGARLQALDHEWDIDRAIEAEAAAMGLGGLAAGALVHRGFLAVPAVAAAALVLFATRGLYPWLPFFRRLGVRSAREIQRERYALKALRGDFDRLRAPAREAASAPAAPPAGSAPAAPPAGRAAA